MLIYFRHKINWEDMLSDQWRKFIFICTFVCSRKNNLDNLCLSWRTHIFSHKRDEKIIILWERWEENKWFKWKYQRNYGIFTTIKYHIVRSEGTMWVSKFYNLFTYIQQDDPQNKHQSRQKISLRRIGTHDMASDAWPFNCVSFNKSGVSRQ